MYRLLSLLLWFLSLQVHGYVHVSKAEDSLEHLVNYYKEEKVRKQKAFYKKVAIAVVIVTTAVVALFFFVLPQVTEKKAQELTFFEKFSYGKEESKLQFAPIKKIDPSACQVNKDFLANNLMPAFTIDRTEAGLLPDITQKLFNLFDRMNFPANKQFQNGCGHGQIDKQQARDRLNEVATAIENRKSYKVKAQIPLFNAIILQAEKLDPNDTEERSTLTMILEDLLDIPINCYATMIDFCAKAPALLGMHTTKPLTFPGKVYYNLQSFKKACFEMAVTQYLDQHSVSSSIKTGVGSHVSVYFMGIMKDLVALPGQELVDASFEEYGLFKELNYHASLSSIEIANCIKKDLTAIYLELFVSETILMLQNQIKANEGKADDGIAITYQGVQEYCKDHGIDPQELIELDSDLMPKNNGMIDPKVLAGMLVSLHVFEPIPTH